MLNAMQASLFELKLSYGDAKALMPGRYGIVRLYFTEVRVQRLTKKEFSFRIVYGIQLKAKGGPIHLRPVLSIIIWITL